MLPRPPLIGELLPRHQDWWQAFISSPWLSIALLLSLIFSIRRHGELAYGSYRSSYIGFLLIIPYMGSQLLPGLSPGNIGLIGALIIVILSDHIVLSLSRSRSTYFVYIPGFLLGLLFMIHPGHLLLYPIIIARLKNINSASARHITALLLGTATVLLLGTMLFAERSLGGLSRYWAELVTPLAEVHLPALTEIPLLTLDLLYLGFVTIAYGITVRSNVVRVRSALKYHMTVAWIMMALHLVYGLSDGGQWIFILGSLFMSGTMTDYFLSHTKNKWLLPPLSILLAACIGYRAHLYGIIFQ
ncbi:MAG: hypothetical protein Q4E10_04540 [Porphyromonas sp.]|nr:hypothetical protein [Porphyromonas sp.]